MEMENKNNEKQLNVAIGKRLRNIRSIFNEGSKLSAEQFAFLLNETRDKILNYELGRAAVPLRVISELYKRGINPIYLIVGIGEIFADNDAGKDLKLKIGKKFVNSNQRKSIEENVKKLNIEFSDLDFSTQIIKVAAGKIKKSSENKENI